MSIHNTKYKHVKGIHVCFPKHFFQEVGIFKAGSSELMVIMKAAFALWF